jgi:hypothetical protein
MLGGPTWECTRLFKFVLCIAENFCIMPSTLVVGLLLAASFPTSVMASFKCFLITRIQARFKPQILSKLSLYSDFKLVPHIVLLHVPVNNSNHVVPSTSLCGLLELHFVSLWLLLRFRFPLALPRRRRSNVRELGMGSVAVFRWCTSSFLISCWLLRIEVCGSGACARRSGLAVVLSLFPALLFPPTWVAPNAFPHLAPASSLPEWRWQSVRTAGLNL